MSLRYRAYPHMSGNEKVAAFVTGYNGSVEEYNKAIEDLQTGGYDVVAYEYDNTVLTDGEPGSFQGLIELIEQDFDGYAATYPWRRYVGVSFGAGLCINLQKRAQAPTEPGVYGSAGRDIAELVFKNPFFKQARRAFMMNGYHEAAVREAWAGLHEPPRVPFAVALGGMDVFVKYRDAVRRFDGWRAAGTPINIITQKRLGHSGILKWFNHHIPFMLAEADKLNDPV